MKIKAAKAKRATEQRIPQTIYFSLDEWSRVSKLRESSGPVKPSIAFFLKTLVFESVESRETAVAK